MAVQLAQPVTRIIEYPESDGKPMAETGIHVVQMVDLLATLRTYFASDPQVYVSGNMFLYYEEGNPQAVVSPDVYFVRGVSPGERRTYKLWEEGKAPDLVIELTSAASRWEDLGNKRALYEWLGIQEYFLFDPLGQYLRPPLRGFRLTEGRYVELTGERLSSQVLGLELGVEDRRLRLYDPSTGRKLLTPAEESAARQAAEAEVARLRAELARLRAGRASAEK
jgi:Uma2 family endonuclease